MSLKVYAHRGIYDNISIFENTLSSFKCAIDHDYAIECDVRLTKDHKVVVFHDKDLKRLFNEDIKINTLTYLELSAYTLGKDRIPLLKDVLELVNGKVDLLIELKTVNQQFLLSKKTFEILKDYNHNFKIQSFSPFILMWYRFKAPEIKRGQLLMTPKQYPNVLGGLVMNSMFFHPFTKPDFYAFNKFIGKHKTTRFLYELFASDYAVWTLKENEQAFLNNHKFTINNISPWKL